MVFEDARLHETAEGWKSEQRTNNVGGVAALVVLEVPGLVLAYYGSENDMLALQLLGDLLLAVAGLIVLAVIYTNLDNKDHWLIELNYNDMLYEALTAAIEAKLRGAGLSFDDAPCVYSLARGRGYAVRADRNSRIGVHLALVKARTKSGYIYRFPMSIRDVRPWNLAEAHRVQKLVNEALAEVDFMSYPEVRD
jgi:hypothetical protein